MGDIVDVFEKHGKKNLKGGGKHTPPMWIRVKKLIEVISVVLEVGIVDLFAILHQLRASFCCKRCECLLTGLCCILVDFIDFLSRLLIVFKEL